MSLEIVLEMRTKSAETAEGWQRECSRSRGSRLLVPRQDKLASRPVVALGEQALPGGKGVRVRNWEGWTRAGAVEPSQDLCLAVRHSGQLRPKASKPGGHL